MSAHAREYPHLVPLGTNWPPAYPAEMRKPRIEGVAKLRRVVTEEETSRDIEVISGDEPFASAAVAAVATWRYEPARIDGRPIAVQRGVRIRHRIDEPKRWGWIDALFGDGDVASA